jgi:Family of unknown function (DUF6221)
VSDLAAFLRARLDEDEAIALAACGHDGRQAIWVLRGHESDTGMIREGNGGAVVVYDEGSPDEAEAAHIARHDPARVLREVAAGRAILELHDGAHECPVYDHNGDIDNCGWVDDGDCPTKRHLAAVYSDHPDYDPGWAPPTQK